MKWDWLTNGSVTSDLKVGFKQTVVIIEAEKKFFHFFELVESRERV